MFSAAQLSLIFWVVLMQMQVLMVVELGIVVPLDRVVRVLRQTMQLLMGIGNLNIVLVV